MRKLLWRGLLGDWPSGHTPLRGKDGYVPEMAP
jgi:hypothetical protein